MSTANEPHDPHKSGRKRPPRRDGRATRDVVLQAAGRVFARRGYAEATGKEICELAGTNGSAVNYYFGGKEKLYEEALIEAHRQMMDLEDLQEIVGGPAAPEEALRAFLGRILRNARESSDAWGVRLFLRELAMPTPFVGRIFPAAVFPKADQLRALVCRITGLPSESGRAQRGTAFVTMFCIGWFMFPEKLAASHFPTVTTDTGDLLDDLSAYVLAGLHGLGKRQAEAAARQGPGGTQDLLSMLQ